MDILKIHSAKITKHGDIGRSESSLLFCVFPFSVLIRCLNNSGLGVLFIPVFFSVIDYEAVVKLSDGFNGADLRNVCTEAGYYTIQCTCIQISSTDSIFSVSLYSIINSTTGKYCSVAFI